MQTTVTLFLNPMNPARRLTIVRIFCCLVLTLFSLQGIAQNCQPLNATAVPDCQTGIIQLATDTAGFSSFSWSPAGPLSNANIYNPTTTTTGSYTVIAQFAGPNMVINPDFAAGNTGFTSGQTFTTNYSPCNYWVGTQWFATYFPGLQDHTPTSDNMFMMIDGCSSPTTIWQEGTFAVIPGDNYQFSFWATESGATQPTYEIHFIGNVTGNTIVATIPGIPNPNNTGFIWDQYAPPLWNAGANSSVTIQIINLQTQGYGNDFGMDDFDFHRLCISTDTVMATLQSLSLNLGPDISICSNPIDTLNAGNGNSFLWSTGDTTQTIIVSAAGTYWVTESNGSCTLSDTIQLFVDPPVNLGPDISLCTNATPTLTASATGTYLWSTGATTQTISPTTPGTYWVTVTNGPCSSSDTIQLLSDPPVNLGPDIFKCVTATETFDAGPIGNYLWSTGATTQSIVATTAGPYWVTVTDGFCVSSDTIQLTIYQPVSLGPDLSICANPTATLDAGIADSYSWNTGDTTRTITVTTAGNYWVTVTNGPCSFTDTISMIMDEHEDLGPDISMCNLFSLTLDAGLATSYVWNTGAATQTISPTDPGQYWVTISTGNCTATDTVELTGMPGEGMVFVPNTFTPNGNGNNEKFMAYGQDVVAFHMQIFDRWGNLIFETNDFNQGWDGTCKGRLVQEDSYVYVIDYKTDCGAMQQQKKIGNVNVIR